MFANIDMPVFRNVLPASRPRIYFPRSNTSVSRAFIYFSRPIASISPAFMSVSPPNMSVSPANASVVQASTSVFVAFSGKIFWHCYGELYFLLKLAFIVCRISANEFLCGANDYSEFKRRNSARRTFR